MLDEPVAEGLRVLDGCFPEPEEVPDLGAMLLDRPAFPVILCPFGWQDLDLRGEIFDNDNRYLLLLPWKAMFVLKELEQSGESEAGCSALISEGRCFIGRTSPVLCQFFRIPLAFHNPVS